MHPIAFTWLGAVPASVESARQTQRAESTRHNSTAMANRELNGESRGIAIPGLRADCVRFYRAPRPAEAFRATPGVRGTMKSVTAVSASRPARDPIAPRSSDPATHVLNALLQPSRWRPARI